MTSKPDPETGPAAAPGFGPRGYLPDRAARRARKIVLRAPLGMEWIVASLVAGVVVLVAGLLVLNRAGSPPGPPWEALGAVENLPASTWYADAGTGDTGTGTLVVNVGGRVRAFVAPEGVIYCAPSNRLEHPDGRVWALTGRGHSGVASLPPVATLTVSGIAYLDRTSVAPPLEPLDTPAVAAC
jgi:hypothetical protein